VRVGVSSLQTWFDNDDDDHDCYGHVHGHDGDDAFFPLFARFISASCHGSERWDTSGHPPTTTNNNNNYYYYYCCCCCHEL